MEDWPLSSEYDKNLLDGYAIASEVIQQIRNIRKQKNISPKDGLDLFIKKDSAFDSRFNVIISRLANIQTITIDKQKPENAFSFLINQFEFSLPLHDAIDAGVEKDRLSKELEYNMGFLNSVQSKLANERFISNAKPEAIENERKKLTDAIAKIKAIKEQLLSLK